MYMLFKHFNKEMSQLVFPWYDEDMEGNLVFPGNPGYRITWMTPEGQVGSISAGAEPLELYNYAISSLYQW